MAVKTAQNTEQIATIAELQDRIAQLESINRALMGRVERSVDSAGNAFTLFESNILLQSVVNERTRQLEEMNSLLMTEISERREAEARIKRSLTEKEVLLKEVHHRVKNNMQIVISLFNLQASRITDSQTAALFRDGQGRVKSMALIHEKLYQSDNLSEVGFAEYVASLCKYLMSTVSGAHGRIEIVNKVDNIQMGIDLAIPCGLIINELVTNSLKYAFPEPRTGTITVSCCNIGGDRIQLSVADNGVGLAAEKDLANTGSLGMQLVRSLTDQLDGHLTITYDCGFCSIVEFDTSRRRSGNQEPRNV